MHRIKVMLRLLTYHRLSAMKGTEGRALSIKLCHGVFSKQVLLGDYIHFITTHSDSASKANIVYELGCECASVAKCAHTARHLRDRSTNF